MKTNGGYIKLHRKVFSDDLAKPGSIFSRFEAWVWLLCTADYEGEYRGVVRTSLRDLACVWGWTLESEKHKGESDAGAVKRVLEAWEADKRVSVENATKTLQKCYKSCYKNATPTRPASTIITIANYDKYQAATGKANKRNATEMQRVMQQENEKSATGSPSSTSTKKEEIKKARFVETTETLSFPSCVRLEKATKDVGMLTEQLSFLSSNLEQFRKKWSEKGVDVDKAFLTFKKRLIDGTPAKPYVNPHKWRWLDMAFDNWCEKALEYGQAHKTPEPEDAGLPWL